MRRARLAPGALGRLGRLSRAGLLGAALLVAATGSVAAADAPEASDADAAGPSAVATFAGGCFWCMEHPFDRIDGVLETVVGYMGGHRVDPTYEQVSSGTTGHAEVVQIRFDPERVSYDRLLEVFWRNIDPLTPNAQFCDRGSQYRSAIFAHDDAQARAARASKQALEESDRFDRPIVTEIVEAGPFYPAETYHQDYADKNPLRYRYYRFSCGRDARLEELWGEEAGGARESLADETSSPDR